nr:hypothetical protein [uncultured Cupriavidus sp.]
MPRDNAATSYPDLLGDFYARWTLDCLVEMAHAISQDFVSRPEFYKAGEVAESIVDLRMEYGTTSPLPNHEQRQDMALPILGASEGYAPDAADKFQSLRKPLFEAVSVFSERSIADSGISMREAILSALQLFQPYLMSFHGVSIQRSYQQMVSVSNLAYAVLRSPGIAQVFGVNPPPGEEWPLHANDTNGALLVRAVGEKLQLGAQYVLNEEKFQRLRRVAHQGREAIKLIVANPEPTGDTLTALITATYTWAISLRDYGVR